MALGFTGLGPFTRRQKPVRQGGGDGLRDFALNDEHIGEIAVIGPGPQRVAAARIDERGGDAQMAAIRPHAAFENGADRKDAGDVGDVFVLALEGEG